MVYGIIVVIVMISTLINVITFYTLNKQGEIIMATLAQLQTKIDELTQAGVEREARDVAQDAVTIQQIALLQATIVQLQEQIANGVAIPDSVIASLQATIDSLNAADPTAPIVP